MAALSFLLILAIAGNAFAHLQLYYPAPFNAFNNPHRTTAEDPFLTYPYNCKGCGDLTHWNYPCRDYHHLLGKPDGAPTATWAAGSQQHWSTTGLGNHYGGSCQIGFSVDGGETFHVATSYEGNCPHRENKTGPEGQEFPFTVPHDLTPGVQLFAWIWYNRETEFNMNCAAVNITAADGGATPNQSGPISYGQTTVTSAADDGATLSQSGPVSYGETTPTATASASASASSIVSNTPTYKTANGLSCTCTDPKDISTCNCDCAGQSSSHGTRDEQTLDQPRDVMAFSSRPYMFVADDGKGCHSPKTNAELKFPEPGPDVMMGDGVYPLELPQGDCTGGGKQ